MNIKAQLQRLLTYLITYFLTYLGLPSVAFSANKNIFTHTYTIGLCHSHSHDTVPIRIGTKLFLHAMEVLIPIMHSSDIDATPLRGCRRP